MYTLDLISDIADGIGSAIGQLGNILLDFLTSIIATVINIIVIPIDTLATTIIPDVSDWLVQFNNGISLLVTAPIGYFAYHIPPLTRFVIMGYLLILIAYYSVIWTYRAIILVPHVIHRIKFW